MADAAAAGVALVSDDFFDEGTSGSHCSINTARFAGREAGTVSFFLPVKVAIDKNDERVMIKYFSLFHMDSFCKLTVKRTLTYVGQLSSKNISFYRCTDPNSATDQVILQTRKTFEYNAQSTHTYL